MTSGRLTASSFPLPEPVREAGLRARRALGDRGAGPNPAWIAALTGARRREVVDVLAELSDLVPLAEQIRHRHLAAGRTFYAQIGAPFDLYAIVRLTRPRHVVEAGVSSGVSSAHFLAALRRNRRGTLHSIDLPTRQHGPVLRRGESVVSLPPHLATGWAVPEPLRAGWDLRAGPAQRLLPQLVDELDSVDLFLHDDLHTPRHLAFELATVGPKLTGGGVALADNVNWTGRSFFRYAAHRGARVVRRGRTNLVGFAVPAAPAAL